MIELVVCGFQTGADIAGARAAKAAGIDTGGWMPLGWRTEEGPRPEYAGLYGAMEHWSPEYPPRTEANVEMADTTIWFGSGDSRGYRCTRKAADRLLKPMLEVGTPDGLTLPRQVAHELGVIGAKVINVAGNRASTSPGIEDRVERFLARVFRILQEG
jgi:hypothetical protein